MLYEGMLHRTKFLAQRRAMIKKYNERHERWVLEVLPFMSDKEWEKYTKWVAAYGYPMRVRRKRYLHRARRATRQRIVMRGG